ncbi:hypothetical protein [Litoribaculum gwangyangense]|uniref:DUF262 domain-containing protein n=1 Tax=Litoribaculum gwangyangense TaxID=1130722 RepID=A0ABP9BX25_9FLAO
MILPLNDPRIQNLQKGEFAIPSLNWSRDLQELDGYNFTVKSRVTSMRNNGFSSIVKKYFLEVSPTTPNEIEPVIMKTLINFDVENDNGLLDLFHLIQLWGGNSSRDRYLKYAKESQSKLFANYKELVSKSLNKDYGIEEITKACRKFCDETRGINISFITKHLRFWQKAFAFENPLPIYDEIMAKYTMDKDSTTNKWNDLKYYWDSMLSAAEQIKAENQIENFSTWELERQLFIFFQSKPEENGWNRPDGTKSKKSTHKSKIKKENIVKNQILKDAQQETTRSYIPKQTAQYLGLYINSKFKTKEGYIDDNGWFCASEFLKSLLNVYGLNWEEGNTRGGSKEKYKTKFKSKDDCIDFLGNNGFIK